MPDFDTHGRAAAPASVPPGPAAVPELPVAGERAGAAAGEARRPLFSAVRWGAVLAGVAVGVAVQLVLTLLGVASGLSTTSVAEGAAPAMGPLVWAGIGMLVAAFVGGYVAARMSGLKRRADGVLHGAVSWAVSTILFAMLAVSIGGALVGGVFTTMHQLAQVQAQAAEGEGPLAGFLRNQSERLDAHTLERIRLLIRNGERDAAMHMLASSTGMTLGRAAEVVDQALILIGTPKSVQPQTPQPPRPPARASERGGLAAWIVFGAVAAGLLLGMGGGRLGVIGSRRENWSA